MRLSGHWSPIKYGLAPRFLQEGEVCANAWVEFCEKGLESVGGFGYHNVLFEPGAVAGGKLF